MRNTTTILAGLLTTLLAGCATEPRKYNFDNSQTFDASMENVWPQTIEFFAERSLPISVIERDSGLITVNDARISMMELSIWADCGKKPLYQRANNRLDLSTRVRESSAESTSVIVTTNYQVYWYDSFSNSGFWKACTSRGLLESAIFGWIGARIGIPTTDFEYED